MILLGLSGWCNHAQAQTPWSNLRTRVVPMPADWAPLDSLPIMPPLIMVSDSLSGRRLPLSLFQLSGTDWRSDTAALPPWCRPCGPLYVSYRVLPYPVTAYLSRIDTANAVQRRSGTDAIEFDYSPYETTSAPWETAGLFSNGTYTRGLTVGNNQNLVFNSALNLQLGGKLGNDLEIQAALSDNSIPLQPDGTTRQLQEFDRIYIRLSRRNVALTAGDFDLVRPQGYFSNYFKRLQGAMVEYQTPFTPGDTVSVRAAAAVSRGKFSRQIIIGQEGNQGPYRLQGAEGERFIIVLAGTEKVFIDGLLLRRGLDDDYVIDYNLGELSFTQRKLVTKDSRIIVEFEYAVQTFLRSTLAAQTEWKNDRGKVYFNLYSEQDGRTTEDLSPEERRRLAEVGDNLNDAFASGVDTIEAFDPDRVLYQYRDTVAFGVPQRILAYSTNPDSARYTARFTEVPMGQGNYIQVPTAANGRVYQWVEPNPLTGQQTGNFVPVVRLTAPEQRQLYALGGQVNTKNRGFARAELALSNRDLNRYSPLNDGDNLGAGIFASLNQPLLQGKNGWQLTTVANYEHASRQFLALNPYRPPEFVRDWNLGDTTRSSENLVRGGLVADKKDWGQVSYTYGGFFRQELYSGNRHFATLRFQRHGFELFAEGNFLQSTSPVENTRFSRPKVDFSKTFFKKDTASAKNMLLKLGVYGERERNERRSGTSDTLNMASFWYDLFKLYFQTPEQAGRIRWGGFASRRLDFFPTGNMFVQNTTGDELNVNGAWTARERPGNARQNLLWNITYRRLGINDPELTNLEAQETYLGRLDYNLSLWKNALSFTSGYEIGSGQSPRVEFSYLPVNPGEGQYTWIDRNQDSVLQVDEMEIAVFQDQASYVRVAVTSTDYVRTNNLVFNQNLRLEPRLIWIRPTNRAQKFLRRFATQNTWQINRRTFNGSDAVQPWNPFDNDLPDSALVTLNTTLRNVLFVNRADPAWDASIAQGDNRSRVLLTTGFESRRLFDYTLHGRVNLAKQWSAEGDIVRGERSSENEAFASRDYDIGYWSAGPKLTWLPLRSFRTVAQLTFRSSRNALGEKETAQQNNWNIEMTWNPQSQINDRGFRAATSLRARFTYADIRYSGDLNSAVAFAMLEGLQDGRNYLWGLSLDRQLSKFFQLSLNYEGRKTGETGMIHTGRAQVRAVF